MPVASEALRTFAELTVLLSRRCFSARSCSSCAAHLVDTLTRAHGTPRPPPASATICRATCACSKHAASRAAPFRCFLQRRSRPSWPRRRMRSCGGSGGSASSLSCSVSLPSISGAESTARTRISCGCDLLCSRAFALLVIPAMSYSRPFHNPPQRRLYWNKAVQCCSEARAILACDPSPSAPCRGFTGCVWDEDIFLFGHCGTSGWGQHFKPDSPGLHRTTGTAPISRSNSRTCLDQVK